MTRTQVSLCILFLLVTCVGTSQHAHAATPLHNLDWCKATFECYPDNGYPIMAFYSEDSTENRGYSCWCSASSTQCVSSTGVIQCVGAIVSHCISQYWGETQAATAGGTYGNCLSCASGYQLSKYPSESPTCWACAVTVPKCAHCSADSVCDQCSSGYTLSSDGKNCFSCPISHCNGCTANGICGSCASGYMLSADKTACYACDSTRCSLCSADNVCAQCQSGYALASDGKTCVVCDITGCETCSADNVCAKCQSSYTLSTDGKNCFSCPIAGCNGCTADGICGSCDSQYSLATDGTKCFSCGISGCVLCSSDDVCSSCASGQVLSPSRGCVACTAANCQDCTSPGDGSTCAVCASGYKLNSKGACTKSGIPWWVWLIIGLGAALLIAVIIIIVCCCCCKRSPDPLHAEEERLPLGTKETASAEADVRKSMDGSSECAGFSTSTWQPTELARRRNRVVSLGGEVVLFDAPADSYQQPSFHRGVGVADVFAGCTSPDHWTFDEAQALNLQQDSTPLDRNPLDPQSRAPGVPNTLRDRRRGKRRGLNVDMAEVDMSEYEAGNSGIADVMDEAQLSVPRSRGSGTGSGDMDT